MSDVSQGPGWWQASDGRWYPPTAPPAQAPPSAPSAYSATGFPATSGTIAPPAGPGWPSWPSGFSSDTPPQPAPTPIFKKAWFLVVCGLVVVAVIGGVAGALSSSSKTPGSVASRVGTAAGGYTQFADHPDRFSISVPVSWHEVDPSSPGAAAALQQIVANNPNLRSAFGAGPTTLLAQGIKFLAVEPDTGSSVAPTVNVVVRPAPGVTDTDLSQILSGVQSQYQQIGATVLNTSTISLAGHQALQVMVQIPFNGPTGGRVTIDETQDIVAANDFVYVISLEGASSQLSKIASSFSVG